MRWSTLGMAALLVVGASAVAGAQTNLVTNGGFENGLTGWSTYASPGCATVGGTFTVGTTTATANSGTTAATVTSPTCYGFLSQTIALIPGHQYVTTVSVNFTGTASVTDNASPMLLDPTHQFGKGVGFSDHSVGWFTFSTIPYTADTDTGMVAVGGNWDGGDLLFDDVSVTDVTTTPEPGSLALLGTGLVGLVPFARRKLRR